MSKKRVAFVANDMTIGGVEQALVQLSKALDYDHYSYVLWLVKKEGPLLEKLDPRMEVRELPCAEDFKLPLRQGKIHVFLKGIYNRVMARRYVKSWRLNQWYTAMCAPMIPEEYDCAIAYHGTTSAVVASVLYQMAAKKRILWVHGDHRISPEQIKFFQTQYRRFDRIICVSEAIRTQFTKQFSRTAEKSEVIYNIIDTEGIRKKADLPIDQTLKHVSLVTVGRLAQEKGQEMIPKTARMLLDSGYEIYWYLVGEGDMRPIIEEEINKYDVGHNVILLGAKENPYPYIKNCDVYVQPSFTEGYCTTTMEAKILHKSIVTTDAPGMREQFVTGEDGLIVKSMTAEVLAEGIKNILDHPEMMEMFRKTLRKESHDNEGVLQKLYAFIDNRCI